MLLTLLGVLMISSTTLGEANNYDLAIRQLVFAGIGVGLMFSLTRIDYHSWRPFAWFLYIGSILLLVFVFFYGIQVRGSVRWIDLGVFRLQPSELVKISATLLLAHILSSHDMKKIKNILLSFAIVLIPASFVYLQPDLGSALVLMAIWFGMILNTEAPKKYFLAAGAFALVSLPIVYNFLLHGYQKTRLLSFINPSQDPLGTGYNVIQSTIAVGSGGLFGLGYGRGTQSHLNFLPEHSTDFIFATLAEELGLVGTLILLILLGIIFWRLIKSIPGTNSFGGLILVGLFVLICFQAAVNIGMNIGLAPVTGITLPFVSYGGSSLITLLAGVGLAQSIIKSRRVEEIIDDQEDLG